MLCVLVRVLGGARWQRHIAEANTVSHLLNIHICPESRAEAILADACTSIVVDNTCTDTSNILIKQGSGDTGAAMNCMRPNQIQQRALEEARTEEIRQIPAIFPQTFFPRLRAKNCHGYFGAELRRAGGGK